MSEELEKFARKRSSDPAQESLRQAKDSWNQEVKLLIAGLIAFKQGMNGRGNPKAGIPPSSIKDPLPPQMGQYLSNIATQYSKIVDDAKKIIDAQAYYSSHRRKSNPKFKKIQDFSAPVNEAVPKAAAIIEPSLIIQGSWWGSRAWAHIALLRKIDKNNRKLRLGMISSAVELFKDLKNFQYKIVERDSNNVPASLTILSSIASSYLSVLLRSFDKLKELYDIKKEVEKDKTPDLKERKISLEERKLSLQEKKLEEQERKQKEKQKEEISNQETAIHSSPAVSVDHWEEFKKIYSQLVKIEVVLRYIFAMENVDKSNFKTMKKAFDKFTRDVNILYDLSKRSDHDKSAVELEKLTQDIINQYKYLLQTSTAVLGAANSFDELATRIPKPKVSIYLDILQNQESLKKEAAGAVSNWLNKMRMSINPDNIAKIKLEMIDSSDILRRSFNSLMDVLEDRDADVDVISTKISEASQKFVELLEQAMLLSKNYMIASRRQEKSKNNYLIDIRQSDIKMLNDLKNDIAFYIDN